MKTENKTGFVFHETKTKTENKTGFASHQTKTKTEKYKTENKTGFAFHQTSAETYVSDRPPSRLSSKEQEVDHQNQKKLMMNESTNERKIETINGMPSKKLIQRTNERTNEQTK